MTQLELPAAVVPSPPVEKLARTTDPESSRAAAEETVGNGNAGRHAAAVLAALESHSWATSIEIWQLADLFLLNHGVDRVELSRRLSSLLERQLVIRMIPDSNPTLRPCRASKLNRNGDRPRLARWALPEHELFARKHVAPGAEPIIDRGPRAASNLPEVANG